MLRYEDFRRITAAREAAVARLMAETAKQLELEDQLNDAKKSLLAACLPTHRIDGLGQPLAIIWQGKREGPAAAFLFLKFDGASNERVQQVWIDSETGRLYVEELYLVWYKQNVQIRARLHDHRLFLEGGKDYVLLPVDLRKNSTDPHIINSPTARYGKGEEAIVLLVTSFLDDKLQDVVPVFVQAVKAATAASSHETPDGSS